MKYDKSLKLEDNQKIALWNWKKCDICNVFVFYTLYTNHKNNKYTRMYVFIYLIYYVWLKYHSRACDYNSFLFENVFIKL